MPVSLPDLAAAVREAGALAHEGWRAGAAPVARVWEKTKGQPVCDADLAVDALLKLRLRALDPDAGWLSEETADDPARLACARLWLVDPIDGTRDYVRGRAGWCVSVALIEAGRPRLAAVHAPVSGHSWIAEAGQGAAASDRAGAPLPLAAAPIRALSGARVPADQLPREDRDLTMVAKPNSIALRMLMVASSEADLVATIRWGNEWDIAAAHLIAAEAGATVSDAFGAPLTYNKPSPQAFGMICAAPGIHAAAVERLAGRAATGAR